MTALCLAPLAHHWPRERVIDFYDRVARLPVEVVSLGETICNKRASMGLRDWTRVAAPLLESGKQVIIASKPLIDSSAEMRLLERLTAQGVMLEVNDFGLAGHLPANPGFVAGPHLNLFNAPAVASLARLGARRWVAPFEMDRSAFAAMLPALVNGMQSELLAYGRVPLAFSTQCYTARSHGRTRHDCLHCCLEHPHGQRLDSLERHAVMVVNGPQTLSHKVFNLMGGLGELQRMGVSFMRLDPPLAELTEPIVGIFHAVLQGRLGEAEALRELAAISPAPFCNGYWLGMAGDTYVPPRASGGFPVASFALPAARG